MSSEIYPRQSQEKLTTLTKKSKLWIGHAVIKHLRLIDINRTVTDLDIKHYYVSRGTKMLVIDGDNTIARHGSPVVEPAIRNHLKAAREAGYIEEISLVSNNLDRELALARGEAIEADSVFTPRHFGENKPMPTMINRAMSEHHATPANTIGIGDGLTDCLAYYRSGIPSALVEGYGSSEALGYPLRSTVRQAEIPLRNLSSLAISST